MATCNFLFFLLALLAMLGEPAFGYWRMPCLGVTGIGRIDPIIAPGKLSAHVHTIKGASGLSEDTTVDQLLASECTSCSIAQDKSAYWAPQMYFWDTSRNTVELVPEESHLVYYKNVPAYSADGRFVQPRAIPNGMRMISGNSLRRNFTLPTPDPPRPWTGGDATQDALEQKAKGFNCLNIHADPEPTLFRHGMPDKSFLDGHCPGGLRLEVLFPICWNGKDLSSPNHRSHLKYSDSGANGGACPAGFDVVINQLLYETVYPIQHYSERQGYFTLSNGDPTGFGYHGDALIAWEDVSNDTLVMIA